MRRIFGFWVMTALGLALGLGAGRPAVSARQAPGDGQRLTRLLERAKGYCLKLERAALDFTCFEKIQEKTYRLPEIELDAAPQLTSVTEYSLEKNGLRFPSKDTTEEAYIKSRTGRGSSSR